jgi:hypothetical protein
MLVLWGALLGAAAAEACFQDQRMLAALLLDGWIFGNVARNGLAKPLMLIYEGLYEEKLMPTFPASDTQFDQRSWQMDRLDTARMEATLHRSGGYRLFIRARATGTSRIAHCIRRFVHGDTRANFSTTRTPNHQSLCGAFFCHSLKGKPEPLIEKLPDEYPETIFEIWKPGLGNKTVARR